MTRLLTILTLLLLAAVLSAVVSWHSHESLTAAAVPRQSVSATRAVEGLSPAASDSRRASGPRRTPCTAHNWRQRLNPAERWIDWHESRLEPRAVEPTTGAAGLGQLEPATYTALGLPMVLTPCAELRAEAVYMRSRYGTWGAALAFWTVNRWW